MSSQTQPISSARFAAALPDLPLSSLHAKAAELQNSILHLERSNAALKEYADDGDADCKEAIEENVVVIERQRERIGLLKAEVEMRGQAWAPELNGTGGGEIVVPRVVPEPGEDAEGVDAGTASAETGVARAQGGQGGRLTDEELQRRLMEQMGADADEDEGMHL